MNQSKLQLIQDPSDKFTGHESSDISDSQQFVSDLMEGEIGLPIEIEQDLSLRAKIIDACGMTCTFCHNEGTPVAIDNRRGYIAIRGVAGPSGRVSVFSSTNGVDFLPGRMEPDENFQAALVLLRETLGLDDLHMTGGEPGLHPKLARIVGIAKKVGYTVGMTSNGESGGRDMEELASAGLSKINFSIFGTTPEELADVQHGRFSDPLIATKKIDALHNAIDRAVKADISIAGNIVMSDETHVERVLRVINEFHDKLSIRILPDLDRGFESYVAILQLLDDLGATPVVRKIEAGSSNSRVKYQLPEGREIFFKQILPNRLAVCGDCELNNPNDCKEGYYGVRLYVDDEGDYKVGVCIQRMDLVMSLEEFAKSSLLQDIVDLRESQYKSLRQQYAGRGVSDA